MDANPCDVPTPRLSVCVSRRQRRGLLPGFVVRIPDVNSEAGRAWVIDLRSSRQYPVMAVAAYGYDVVRRLGKAGMACVNVNKNPTTGDRAGRVIRLPCGISGFSAAAADTH